MIDFKVTYLASNTITKPQWLDIFIVTIFHTNPSMIIHILEYIRLPRDIPRSKSIRDIREIVWIHRLNTLIPNGLNIVD